MNTRLQLSVRVQKITNGVEELDQRITFDFIDIKYLLGRYLIIYIRIITKAEIDNIFSLGIVTDFFIAI